MEFLYGVVIVAVLVSFFLWGRSQSPAARSVTFDEGAWNHAKCLAGRLGQEDVEGVVIMGLGLVHAAAESRDSGETLAISLDAK